MKSTAEGVPRKVGVSDTIARSRARQGLLVAVVAAACVASYFGFTGTRKSAASKVVAHLASAAVTSPGMVTQVLVKQGQWVRKGELLAVLDYSHVQAELAGAEAEYQVALAKGTGSTVATALPAPPNFAGGFEKRPVVIAEPAQTYTPPPLPTSKHPVAKLPEIKLPTSQAPTSAKAAPKVAQLQDEIKKTQAEIPDLQKKIDDDKAAADSAQALAVAAQSVADRSKTQKDKSASLLAEGVISAKEAAQADSNWIQAQGQLQAARLKATEAEAMMGEDQRDLDKANEDLKNYQTELPKAQAAQAAVANQPPQLAPISKPEPGGPPPPEPQKYKLVKLKGPVMAAPPPEPLQVDFTSPAQAAAQLKKAETDLAIARQNFAAACIYAPETGQISKINVKVGQMAKPGIAAFVIQIK
jgi:multidrug resistance efflux pump